MTPQARTILKHLQTGRHITPLEAIGVYGVYRLAARILEIRAAGYTVSTNKCYDAKRKQYARYVLEKPDFILVGGVHVPVTRTAQPVAVAA